MTEWISVDNKLPEDQKPKLVRYTSSHRSGVYYGIAARCNLNNVEYACWYIECGNTQGIKITHYTDISEVME